VCLASVLSNLGGGFFASGEEPSAVPERPDDIIFNCNGLELEDFDRNGGGGPGPLVFLATRGLEQRARAHQPLHG
jgi:hypothetical protein